MTAGQFFSYLASGIGIVGFLGAVAVYLRGSADKGTITSLQSSVSALEIENKLKAVKITELEGRITSLTEQVVVYQNTVTQAKEVAALTTMLADHHKESMSQLQAIRTEMTHDR